MYAALRRPWPEAEAFGIARGHHSPAPAGRRHNRRRAWAANFGEMASDALGIVDNDKREISQASLVSSRGSVVRRAFGAALVEAYWRLQCALNILSASIGIIGVMSFSKSISANVRAVHFVYFAH